MPHFEGSGTTTAARFALNAAFNGRSTSREPLYRAKYWDFRTICECISRREQARKKEGPYARCGVGYQGRVGTYELMKVNRPIREAIKQERSTHEIESIAQENEMLTLKAYAVDLIVKQLTTISELQKICNTDE